MLRENQNGCAMKRPVRRLTRMKFFLPAWSVMAICLAGAPAGGFRALAESSTPGESDGNLRGQASHMELRGKVVCLPEELHRLYGTELPTAHEHVWGFKTDEGELYTLLRTHYSEALFLDETLREKELILKAKLFPESRVIEVTRIHSFHDGQEYDLYYYCDVCSIKTVSPEKCLCCQGPVHLVEKPLSEEPKGEVAGVSQRVNGFAAKGEGGSR